MDKENPARLQAITQLYKEQSDHGRHIETQRHALTAMLLTLAGALLAASAVLRFQLESLPLSVLIILIGILGRKFVLIYTVKWKEISARRDHYRVLLQEGATIDDAPSGGSAGTLRKLWMKVFVIVIWLGLTCAGLIVANAALERIGWPTPGAPPETHFHLPV